MVLDNVYKNKLEKFLNTAMRMQNEVEAGTILDENAKSKYEAEMGLAIPVAYKTAVQLYAIASNGRKEEFTPYFIDISALISGFQKYPFSEILTNNGIKIESLDVLTDKLEKAAKNKTTNESVSKINPTQPLKIVRSGSANYYDEAEYAPKETGPKPKEDMKIQITHDIKYF